MIVDMPTWKMRDNINESNQEEMGATENQSKVLAQLETDHQEDSIHNVILEESSSELATLKLGGDKKECHLDVRSKFDVTLFQVDDREDVSVEKELGVIINHSSWVREELEILSEVHIDWVSLEVNKDMELLPLPDLGKSNMFMDMLPLADLSTALEPFKLPCVESHIHFIPDHVTIFDSSQPMEFKQSSEHPTQFDLNIMKEDLKMEVVGEKDENNKVRIDIVSELTISEDEEVHFKSKKMKGREEEQEKVGRHEEEKEGGQVMVDISKDEGGQEVDLMSKEKEKGGEEQEELSKIKEEGREESKKDVGQDMDTIMQTLDALVENIMPPTTTAKMPPSGEKKRKVVKAISPSSLTRRVKEARRTRSQSALLKFAQCEVRRDYRGRKQLSIEEVWVIDNFLDTTRINGDNILEPKKDGWGAYVNPEHIISLLFGKELESTIIDMFLLLLRRKTEDQPSEYYEYDCLPAYGKVKFLKEGFLEIFGLDTTEWPVVVPSPCPQQGARDDYALFVFKYIECGFSIRLPQPKSEIEAVD
ncbi:hypothetical protein Taro_056211 [Colocasia esculenta]|uniref:Uncharacterized protein n=1 Tax=Colocasia esculenta TaxID=4460 RepID=A0A843XSX0_COLES|nr:hypothetical protein [Colocasia esculenta]